MGRPLRKRSRMAPAVAPTTLALDKAGGQS